MRIQKVNYKNFRNIPDGEYDLKGQNIVLLAENTKGKSNFIKGILAVLGSASFGKKALRDDSHNAEIELLMADYGNDFQSIEGTDYTFKARIRKKKDGDEEVMLEVVAPNGMRDTKKTIIGSIAGELELDYNFVELSRTAAGKKKQIEIIKSYLDDETKTLLRIQEQRVQKAYDDRTEIGRLMKNVQGFINESLLEPGDFEKFTTVIDTKPLKDSLENAGKVNQQIIEVKKRIDERKKSVADIENDIINLEAQISEKRSELISIATKNSEANKWLVDNKEVNTDEIKRQLEASDEHNKKVEKVALFKNKKKEADDYELQYGELGALVDIGRQEISNLIRNMDFPIAGISFDDNNAYYNGKLINENNMSTAEIMLLEAQLKMCKAPGAQVLFIQRGESLGLHLLKELQQSAKANGFQIVMEQVERGTEELKIEMMVDLTI